MKGNINSAGEASITVLGESSVVSANRASTSESESFTALTAKLVQVPKTEIDEKRKQR
jgi:hypothetical protein